MKKVVHIFGMTNTGKTTIAKAMVSKYPHINIEHIDADEHRLTTCKDLGFSKEDRIENVRRLTELANNSKADIVLLTAVTPFEQSRSAGNFNVMLSAPLDVLVGRDTKEVYSRTEGVAGVSSPFEDAQGACLRLDTREFNVQQCVDEIIRYAGLLPKYAMFVGRWQTLHAGHDWLFNQRLDKGENVLICIRDVAPSQKDPLTASEVRRGMEERYSDLINEGRIRLLIIPDISSINYGRDVGYEVVKHDPPEDIGRVSGTSIRASNTK